MPVVRTGTSGWQYRHWRDAFYPPDVPQNRWLEYYAGRFATVESNATFYRLPARETLEQWRARTPDWGYLRFHEGDGASWPRYTEGRLRDWAKRAADAWPGDAPVYAYFNNDQRGAAVLDAEAFALLSDGRTARP